MTRSSAPAALPSVRTTLAALGAGLVLAALAAAPASAHTELASSSPADGATVGTPPAQVVLTFTEAPVALGAQVVVTGPDGPESSGAPRVDGLAVVTDVQPSAPAGRHTVEWRLTSEDGHPVTGTFAFTASAAGGAPSAEAPGASATPAPAEAPRREPLIPSWGWIAAGVIAIVAAIRLNRRAGAANKQQGD